MARDGSKNPPPTPAPRRSRLYSRLALALLFASFAFANAYAAKATRVVVIKVDGLPQSAVERFINERDPRTRKSLLPWFKHVFYERGTRLNHFYVRGMSLSGPSWSLLDTGQHLQIKGNVEFDRYTLHSYDYLNFIPFWIANVGGVRIDMPGTELLDELGIPLYADAYPYDERHLSFQLYQRGTRWTTLQRGLQNRFTSRSPRELLDEWTLGIGARSILNEQQERELLEKLNNPRIRYLDFYTTDFDHAAHHNRDRATHLDALRELDALVGRIWVAIQKTPQAATTALVLVSDHGTNTDESIYSQGYNLVKFLGRREGGGHHVVTKRRLLNDYALKGIYPLIPLIHTTTDESYYLKGESTTYPTALVDFDGNERTSIHLRDSELNLLHILLLQLKRDDLAPNVRRAATRAFFNTLDGRRAGWQRTLEELREELGALRRLIEEQRKIVEAQPKKWTKADQDAGRDKDSRRHFARLDSWMSDERTYSAYAQTLANLLSLDPERFNPAKVRVEDLFVKGSMGDSNSVHQLQNYVVGPAPGGLVVKDDGSLDLEKSFVRINYFESIHDITVRNNVQDGIGNRPVDFLAVRLPVENLRDELDEEKRADEAVWLYGGRDRQALILARRSGSRTLLRYLPVAALRQDAAGRISFERKAWGDGLPLKIWEDAHLYVPEGQTREAWLDGWHTDLEWLRAAHRTKYPHAVTSLHEQLSRHATEMTDANAPGISEDERLIRRFRHRQRLLVETDLLVLANDHWNFDVRGFNPGGNHGSFFHASAHSTLMFYGGDQTGIPRGEAVDEPYDSLSFLPTIMALTGQLQDERRPVPVLWNKGFRQFPGRVIEEVLGDSNKTSPLAKGRNAEAQPR